MKKKKNSKFKTESISSKLIRLFLHRQDVHFVRRHKQYSTIA